MIARAAVFVVLLVAVCASAQAQRPREPVRPPRALLQRMLADLDEQDDLAMSGIDSLAKWITVEREDFNGDGVREWVVQGTRFCGSNCSRWIYRRRTDGRFVQVYAGSGTGVVMRPERSLGWHNVREYSHMSCCDGPNLTYVFDGRRYQWRETRYMVWDNGGPRARTAYRVYVTPPEAPGPQRLLLDPQDAGGGLWISARYDQCRPGRARTDACGAPQVILSSARLPTGRVCVRMRASSVTLHREYEARPGGGWCGVTAPDPQARGRRRLVVRPSRGDWVRILQSYTLVLAAPGLPSALRRDGGEGLADFANHLQDRYWLPCEDGYRCTDLDRR